MDYDHVGVDIHAGETQTPDFLALNPAGQIPLLVLDDGRTLAESNAIIRFLADGSDLVPTDVFDHAKMLQWQFWEQYRHEPAIAVARFIAAKLFRQFRSAGRQPNRRAGRAARRCGAIGLADCCFAQA